jgi:hypothetical protein
LKRYLPALLYTAIHRYSKNNGAAGYSPSVSLNPAKTAATARREVVTDVSA